MFVERASRVFCVFVIALVTMMICCTKAPVEPIKLLVEPIQPHNVPIAPLSSDPLTVKAVEYIEELKKTDYNSEAGRRLRERIDREERQTPGIKLRIKEMLLAEERDQGAQKSSH